MGSNIPTIPCDMVGKGTTRVDGRDVDYQCLIRPLAIRFLEALLTTRRDFTQENIVTLSIQLAERVLAQTDKLIAPVNR